jgi:LuxR family maltose regulon positive regulatory protein
MGRRPAARGPVPGRPPRPRAVRRRVLRQRPHRPGSEQILLDLEDANAFVESLDPGRTWFRYHHLFADLLRLELRRTLPAEIPALHRRAAGWFTQHAQMAEAIRHTQAAGDWPEAAQLLADHSFSLTLDGQAQTMQVLLRAFPGGYHR